MTDRKKLADDMLDMFGPDAQLRKTVEEMAELTQAICKALRARDILRRHLGVDIRMLANHDLDRIAEEAADVLFMLEQVRLLVGADRADLAIFKSHQRATDVLSSTSDGGA